MGWTQLKKASWMGLTLLACGSESAAPSPDELLGERSLALGANPAPATPLLNIDMESSVSFQNISGYPTGLGLPLHTCHVLFTHQAPAGVPPIESSIGIEGSACGDQTGTGGGSGGQFNTPRIDPGGATSEDFTPYVSPRVYYPPDPPGGPARNAHSLQLSLPARLRGTDKTTGFPCDNGTAGCVMAPDRSELLAYGNGFEKTNGVGFGFNDPKYFGFAIYIDPSTRLPLDSAVHFMQAWQFGVGRANGQGFCGVPLTTTVANSDDGGLVFYATAADNSPDSVATDGLWDVVGNTPRPTHPIMTPLPLGVWNTFVFYLSPSSMEQGHPGVISIWFNGALIADWHHTWGCNVLGQEGKNYPFGPLSDAWHLKVGMYRTGDGVISGPMYMFVDNVRVASSKRQVDAGWGVN